MATARFANKSLVHLMPHFDSKSQLTTVYFTQEEVISDTMSNWLFCRHPVVGGHRAMLQSIHLSMFLSVPFTRWHRSQLCVTATILRQT